MRIIYTLLLRLLAPVLLLRAAWRARTSPVGGERLAERLGLVEADSRRPLLVHCVSVGETLAALPLLRALHAAGRPLWVTSTTLTGAERVRMALGDGVRRSFLPLDTPGAVARFLDRVRPCALLVMETEIWPNLLHACRARGIPVLLVNARLSEKSARGYARFPAFTRSVLSCFTRLLVQAGPDADRFRALGATQVEVTGNLKFDMAPDEGQLADARALRAGWSGRPVWIAASTHPGEDEIVLAAHRLLRESLPELLLVLVPRHPERFDAVAAGVSRAGFSCARRNRGEAVVPGTAVYLADTMGELQMLYACADVAFVGGSFSGTGGHNMLEPAALGVPVVTGPSLFNFEQVADALRAVDALVVVADTETLAQVLRRWLQDEGVRSAAGERARAFVAANRGALARTLERIDALVPAGSRTPQ